MDDGAGCPACEDVKEGTVNFLTITNNEFDNSEDDGIHIGNGAFQSPVDFMRDDVPGEDGSKKSIISGNEIHHNIDDGIDLYCSFGINIRDNDIHTNGDDVNDDAGIEIDTSDGLQRR